MGALDSSKNISDGTPTNITNLFKDGWDISSVAVVSGHKSWSELQKYTRIKAIDLVEKINKK